MTKLKPAETPSIVIETGISYIHQLENGIIRIETKKDIVATEQDLNENYTVYRELLGNDQGLFLVILNPRGESDDAAKAKYVDRDRSKIKKAEAVVVKDLAHRIEMNFYKNFNKLGHPVNVFNSEEEAISWLLEHK